MYAFIIIYYICIKTQVHKHSGEEFGNRTLQINLNEEDTCHFCETENFTNISLNDNYYC
jgi:hypothetical protein